MYVSPYSMFMIENYPLNLKLSNSICDFGSGTGVLGIVASIYNSSKIVSIEKDNEAISLSMQNYSNNVDKRCNTLFYNNKYDCHDLFDTIICNPASLPDIADVSGFCNGGALGMDMILEAIEFAYKHLSKDGRLYMIITSILPKSIAEYRIKQNGMDYNIYAKKIIPFRNHYKNITEWVDNLNTIFNEMYYLKINNNYYEELFLWEIYRN